MGTRRGKRTFEEIAEVIGAEKATTFCEHFGGMQIYVPTKEIVEMTNRHELIRAEYDRGEKVKNICRRYGIGERQVRRILSGK